MRPLDTPTFMVVARLVLEGRWDAVRAARTLTEDNRSGNDGFQPGQAYSEHAGFPALVLYVFAAISVVEDRFIQRLAGCRKS